MECAEAALALYRKHRGGNKQVCSVIYSHSHIDHFGGVMGVVSEQDVKEGKVSIIAPIGFMEHAIAENVYAGPAMGRRAGYMYGAALQKSTEAQVGCGLGQVTSTGTVSLIPPTIEIQKTGQILDIDGIQIEFQLTPGTEAPSEMNFYFPHARAVFIAENASQTMHNIYTLRGALVRDAKNWARYLTESIDLYAARSQVLLGGHFWPTFGTDRLSEFLMLQRDLYQYLHDQTLRLANQGLVGAEIAEQLKLPPALERSWHLRGYYGSLSHNVKAIYQRYLGWYDGNPSNLWPHPPIERATRYIELAGGADKIVENARCAMSKGDFRWAVEILNYVTMVSPNNKTAVDLHAAALEQLGWGAENGTWRNAYLSGVTELRKGAVFGSPTSVASAGNLLKNLAPDHVFDALAIAVGPKAWDEHLFMGVVLPDLNQTFLLELRNGVLIHKPVKCLPDDGKVKLVIRGASSCLPNLLFQSMDGLELEGDPSVFIRFLGVMQPPNPAFPIMGPRPKL